MSTLPEPADFGPAPTQQDRSRWREADLFARSTRVARIRERLKAAGLDAYFGVRPEHMRYLTGFSLKNGEEKIAGFSGQFFVGLEEVVILADNRYRTQAVRQATGVRVEPIAYDLRARWPDLLASIGARHVAAEAAFVSYGLWTSLTAAAPDIDLVPVDGWVEADRAIKEPAEIERIRAACAVADRALAAVLRSVRPGRTEQELALQLEWLVRTDGAEAMAFDPMCLAGPGAAAPHGSPSDRPVQANAVLLFDFGAQVDGYRSDLARTVFIGEPRSQDQEIYDLVARAQRATIDFLESAVAAGEAMPSGKALDAVARGVIESAGHGRHFEHATGHGIGLATHELPNLSRVAADTPIPSPTVFSVEPGVYLENDTGVRIEDLLLVDAGPRRVERLSQFPRDAVVVEIGA
jgi:Xaa-Pro aminopeptidase